MLVYLTIHVVGCSKRKLQWVIPTSSTEHKPPLGGSASARLERRQELEKEEALLKARNENLDLATEIAANAAKLNIINKYEDTYIAQPQSMDMMN